MTTLRTIILSAAVTLALPATPAMAADGWGASWSFGPVHPTTTNHIIYTKTTIVPGRLPPITSSTGPLFLWPGLSNPTSDLIQTTMDAWPDNASYCGAKTGQWCVEGSVFGSFGQRNGPTVAIDPDDHVTIEYKLGSDNNTWTQTVTSQKLAKVVSTLTSTSGLMYGGGFGFATEADANSYTIDTQYYLCTEIHLAAADPSFGATGVGAAGAMYGATGTGSGRGTAKNLRTPDGGLTWLVDLITLPAMTPQGAQTPAPAYDCGASGTGGTDGSGGSSGSGGTKGSGGAGAAGGHGGTGGSAPGTGGTGTATGGKGGGAGGSGGHGGAGGKGGSPSTGGTPGSGGSSGAGGASASGSGGHATGGVGSGGSPGTGGATGGTTGGGGQDRTGGSSGGSETGGATGTGTGGSAEGDGAGCSCEAAPGSGALSPALLLLAVGLLVGVRARRRRSARRPGPG
jgi:MYXO-CTERM domain-containing protein